MRSASLLRVSRMEIRLQDRQKNLIIAGFIPLWSALHHCYRATGHLGFKMCRVQACRVGPELHRRRLAEECVFYGRNFVIDLVFRNRFSALCRGTARCRPGFLVCISRSAGYEERLAVLSIARRS